MVLARLRGVKEAGEVRGRDRGDSGDRQAWRDSSVGEELVTQA